ncbi:hypothetical protein AB0M28_08590 [Streptomyces sp. NPDC051940]|uniref:hypothetical protein n=1 Tax=Streptomyces sp. NPDC051940 TaxID=3155675 RepID=UPI00343457BF
MNTVAVDRSAQAAEFAEIGGGRVLWQLGSYEEEYAALRSAVGLLDLSGSGPLRVSGPDAAALLNRALSRDVEFLAPEQARSSLVLREDGGLVDVVVVLSVAEEDYLVHCGPGRADAVLRALHDAAAGDDLLAEAADLAGEYAVYAIEGPQAWRPVAEVFGEDYVSLAYESLLPAELDGVEAVLARIGLTGEYGYTLFVPREVAPRVWEALEERAVVVGHRALETAMLEVRQPVLHREAGPDSTVLTTGLNWLVDLSKEEFTGRDAVLAQRAAARGTRPIGIGVAEGELAPGDELFVAGEHVGRVRHVVHSPGYGGQLGIAEVHPQWQAARLEFTSAAGARAVTLAAPYVVPASWTTPMEV